MARSDRVVVAVGAEDDGRTVDWAAAEAAARGCALHLVCAQPLNWVAGWSGLVPVGDIRSEYGAAEELLRAAVLRARTIASDLEVSAEALFGPTVSVLAALAGRAQLLVLSGRPGVRAQGLRGRLASSIAADVAAVARCPVAVVGPLPTGPRSGAPPRVVVGVDGRTSSAALGFAFRAAAQRQLPVTALHVWAPDLPADLEAVRGSSGTAEVLTRAVLERALAPVRCAFPDVPVERCVAGTDPVAELVRRSDGAALVVLGTRGRGAVRAGLFGSVSRSVSRQARCPVVVVRPDGRARSGSAHSDRRTGGRPGRHEPLRRWGAGWG